jgi:hypothetical protein
MVNAACMIVMQWLLCKGENVFGLSDKLWRILLVKPQKNIRL